MTLPHELEAQGILDVADPLELVFDTSLREHISGGRSSIYRTSSKPKGHWMWPTRWDSPSTCPSKNISGTGISARPPHRSERAQFTHSAPTSGDLRRSALLARDVESAASAAIDRLAASSFPRLPPRAGCDAGASVAMRR